MLNLNAIRASRKALALKKEERASNRLSDRHTAILLVDTLLHGMIYRPLEAVQFVEAFGNDLPTDTLAAFRKAVLGVMFPAVLWDRVALATKVSAVEKLATIVEAKGFSDFGDFVTAAAIHFGFADLLSETETVASPAPVQA